MGRPKLLMEFEGETLDRPRRDVAPRGRRRAGRRRARRPTRPRPPRSPPRPPAPGAEVVVPETQPAEMRDSVELGLDGCSTPSSARHVVLLTPGDCPGITAELVARLLDVARQNPGPHRHPDATTAAAVIRSFCPGKSRHPGPTLPDGAGVNALVAAHRGVDHRDAQSPAPGDRRPTWTRRPTCDGGTKRRSTATRPIARTPEARFTVPGSALRPREGAGGPVRARDRARPRLRSPICGPHCGSVRPAARPLVYRRDDRRQ